MKQLMKICLVAVACVSISGTALAQTHKKSTKAKPKTEKAKVEQEPAAAAPAASSYSSGGAMARPNVVSFELLGRGGLYSFNYDRAFVENFGAGVGLSLYSISGASVLLIPVYGNYYFLNTPHRPFVTAGFTYVNASSGLGSGSGFVKAEGVAASIGGGYEYRGDSGFVFRAAPYLFLGKSHGIWIGLSGGYAF